MKNTEVSWHSCQGKIRKIGQAWLTDEHGTRLIQVWTGSKGLLITALDLNNKSVPPRVKVSEFFLLDKGEIDVTEASS